jgi:hypothetical protein
MYDTAAVDLSRKKGAGPRLGQTDPFPYMNAQARPERTRRDGQIPVTIVRAADPVAP